MRCRKTSSKKAFYSKIPSKKKRNSYLKKKRKKELKYKT
jgi:hypothetical protein